MSGEDEAREPAERGGPDGRGDRPDRDARADRDAHADRDRRTRRRAAPEPKPESAPDLEFELEPEPEPETSLRPRKAFFALRVTAAVLGPILLTVAYFTLPFDPLSHGDRVLPWVILSCLLGLLAAGMLVTTVRAMTDDAPGHPGLVILLLSWASILVFAAIYWSLAIGHHQVSGLQTRLDALYFTGVTMATVGYGDIYPSGQGARAVVLVQLLYTFAFLAGGVTATSTRVKRIVIRRMNR